MEKFLENITKIYQNSSTSYTCYALNTKKSPMIATQIPFTKKQLQEFSKSCLHYLTTHVYSKKQLAEYPHGNPKDHIERISCKEERIKEKYDELIFSITSPETSKVKLEKYDSYVIVSTLNDEKSYFLTKKKILKSYKKNQSLFSFAGETLEEMTNPILNLIYHFDYIIYNEYIYIITLKAESMLGLEISDSQKAKECTALLIKNGLIDTNDIESINKFLKKPGKYRCLSNANESLIESLGNITPDNKDHYEKKYHLSFIEDGNGNYKVDIENEEKLIAFINTITNKRGKNFDDETVTTPSPFQKSS